MEVFVKIAQLITSLSILVLLHEAGHFVFARLFKVRVEKFYLFFNPWFSLFKLKRGETEYGIGWLPLGGYVKISGMIDESMDKEAMKLPPQPHEFRSKPSWQRLLIMIGGVVVNLILGFLIYAAVLFTWGESYLKNDQITDGIWVIDPIANEIGFETGDKIQSINGEVPVKFSDILNEVMYGGEVKVIRNGEPHSFNIPEDIIQKIIDLEGNSPIYVRQPFFISNIPDTSINIGSELKSKDKVVKINDKEIKYFDEFKMAAAEFSGKEANLTVIRNEKTIVVPVNISENGLIGVVPATLKWGQLKELGVYDFETKKYTLAQSIPAGFNRAYTTLSFYIRQFKLILNPSTGAYKGLGGFGTIGNLFPGKWHWQTFWELTAFLSLILAFMNILPIPALDGGHVIFLLGEMITGRKPGEKFLEYAQIAGMILLLALLIFANANDVVRWWNR